MLFYYKICIDCSPTSIIYLNSPSWKNFKNCGGFTVFSYYVISPTLSLMYSINIQHYKMAGDLVSTKILKPLNGTMLLLLVGYYYNSS